MSFSTDRTYWTYRRDNYFYFILSFYLGIKDPEGFIIIIIIIITLRAKLRSIL